VPVEFPAPNSSLEAKSERAFLMPVENEIFRAQDSFALLMSSSERQERGSSETSEW